MREILLVIKGNFRKNKGTYIGIAIMMFIVAVSLTAVISVLLNTHKRDWELMESSGFGHIIAGMKYSDSAQSFEDYKADCEAVAEEIRACKDVEKVDVIDILLFRIHDVNGGTGNSTSYVINIGNPIFNYNIYDENGDQIENIELNSGEIIVPISFKELYDCEIGDNVILTSESIYDVDENGDQKEYSYKVVAYMEDPYMGGSVMGIKTMFISDEDFNQLFEEEFLGTAVSLSIFQDPKSDMSITEFDAMLNSETEYSTKTWFTINRTQSNTYMTLIINIFSAVLILFVVMIVVATMIVLSNNISSSIEQDFVNIGILKAVGLTNAKLKISLMLGYLIAIGISSVAGMVLSTPLIAVINKLITPTVGLYGDNTPRLLFSFGILVVIFFVFVAFIFIKLTNISKISPVRAINLGREDVHFSSLFKLPISKKIFATSLAYRQITSGKKQYVGVTLITAILIFFMVSMTEVCIWFGNGGENLYKSFSTIEYDMYVTMIGDETFDEVHDIIMEYDSGAIEFIYSNRYILMNDTQIASTICDKPEFYNVYKGRTCTYDNEIVITEYLVKNYGIDIGDTVKINIDGNTDEFIVTGYFTCANDAGKCIGLNYDGFAKLSDDNVTEEEMEAEENEDIIWQYTRAYKLSDSSKAREIVSVISEKYDETEAIAEKVDYIGGIEPVVVGIYGITVIIYVIAGIFVAVTVAMICSKLFAKEKQDNGVYKAMGLTSNKLRGMFATRFAIVAVIGSLVGLLIVKIFSNMVIGFAFSTFGLYNFKTTVNPISAVVPIVVMTLLYYAFAWVSSKKIKKLTPRVLIVE